ncbi:MAG: T9SS type A sorting domain-containing protein [Bacteroidia bacterium]|nr:T9SS type A sorting domain-containing protein [Bacteroidia bacterium]
MKTLKIYIVSFMLLFTSLVGYSQNWQWASQVGSAGQDASSTLIADKYGNSYFAGSFQGSNCYFQTDTLSMCGAGDFFLVKYDNTGNELWIKQFGGCTSNTEGAGGLCYDSTNNFIYMTGFFAGTMTFGCTWLSSSNRSFYLAKFDLNGNCIWAKQSTGAGVSSASGVALDKDGNLYVCGTTADSATFDTYTIPRGGFLAKYDANGNCLWAQNKFRYVNNFMPSELTPQAINIVDSTIVISGTVGNDTIIVDTITIIHNGINAAFISAFDMVGDVKWLKLAGGGGNSGGGFDFSVDKNGNSYTCGTFSGTGTFDTIVLTNPMNDDAFIAKYNIFGELQWVKQLNASGGAWGKNLSANIEGVSYMTGYFSGTANFGTYTVTASTTQDMFVARYDSNGVCLGVRNFGKAQGSAVCTNNDNEYWVAGIFLSPTVTIGNTTFNNYTTSGYPSDLFVAKGDAPIGIETYQERKTANALHIYANPNKGTCNITIPDELLNEQNLVLIIYDVSGKIIQQQPVQIAQEKIKINLEAEAKGVYNVTLGNTKKIYSGKIVFE